MGWRFTVLSLFVLAADSLAQLSGSTFSNGNWGRFGRNYDMDDHFNPNADRSYKFGFTAEDHSREEESDKDGLVMGKYSYVDFNGIQRSLSYKAGANIGFVPNLDNFSGKGYKKMRVVKKPRVMKKTTSPARFVTSFIPAQPRWGYTGWGYSAPVINPLRYYAPLTLYQAPTAPSAPALPVLPTAPVVLTSPVVPNLPVLLNTLYEAPAPPQPAYEPDQKDRDMVEEKLNTMMDPSYSFKYDAEFSSREESADGYGNIKGKYAYTNELGSTIIVEYSAGADKGFVIENEDKMELDVAEAREAVVYADMAIEAFNEEKEVEEPVEQASIYFKQPTINPDDWIQSKAYSYSVSGANEDLIRSETADENGAVTGTYTIPDVNGDPIVVKYRAGPLTGFIIENFDEVQSRTDPASAPTAPVNQDSIQITPVLVPEPIISYAKDPIPSVTVQPIEPFVDPLHEENSDRSYKFSHVSEPEDGSILRQEESDADGNIKGKYSYVNAEGNTIEVKYKAGADIGFVVENEEELKGSVEKATNEAAKKVVARRRMKVVKRPRLPSYKTAPTQNSYQAPHPGIPTSYVAPAKETTYQDVEVEILPPVSNENHESYESHDQSYYFNVQSENSSFQEDVDEEGERTGSYSYIDANGQNVVVRYKAGKDGFVILNPDDVLPKPPQAY